MLNAPFLFERRIRQLHDIREKFDEKFPICAGHMLKIESLSVEQLDCTHSIPSGLHTGDAGVGQLGNQFVWTLAHAGLQIQHFEPAPGLVAVRNKTVFCRNSDPDVGEHSFLRNVFIV